MRNLFLGFFRNLLNLGVKSKEAMKQGWKLAKIQGNDTVTFILASNGQVTQRKTSGTYTPYIAKNGKTLVKYENENGETRSFVLSNLIK